MPADFLRQRGMDGPSSTVEELAATYIFVWLTLTSFVVEWVVWSAVCPFQDVGEVTDTIVRAW